MNSQFPTYTQGKSSYGIYPFSLLRYGWEYIMYFMSLLCLWEIPYELIFDFEKTPKYVFPALVIDFFYFVDLFIVMRTGVLKYGVVQLDKKSILSEIPKWKLVIYWISPWPYYLIGYFVKSNALYNILICLKALRIVRLKEASRLLNDTLVFSNPVTLIMTLFCVLITIAHFSACIFWYTGHREIPGKSWLIETKIAMKSKSIQYFHTLYYITTTILTIGYGDLHPYTFPEVCVVIAVEAVGVFFYNYLVSTMVSIVADPSRNLFLSKYQKIYSAFKTRNVSDASLEELMRYYEYVWEKNHDRTDFYETASKLPEGIQRKLAFSLHEDIFGKTAAFQGASREVLESIALALIPRIFTPGDFLLKAGRISNRMYFINEGKVGLVNSNGIIVGECDGISGSVIGEASLLKGTPETISSIAVTYVEAFELLKEDYDEIIEMHPQLETQLRQKGGQYQNF